VENILSTIISRREYADFAKIISILRKEKNKHLLRNDILLKFDEYCDTNRKTKKFRTDSTILRFFNRVPELITTDDSIYIKYRHTIARYRFYRLGIDGNFAEETDINSYLRQKEIFTLQDNDWLESSALELDFLPFYDYSPSIRDSKSIGDGIRFLNKHLSSNLFQNPEKWGQKLFEFIMRHEINRRQLLVNGRILKDKDAFLDGLKKAIEWLGSVAPDKPYSAINGRLKKAGFQKGWGNTAGRAHETMTLLYDLLNEPDSTLIEKFISRIPIISKIAIISPHGWFGQANVLGRPDTGGQVVYILDQVRALEKYLKQEFDLAGIAVAPKIMVLTRLIPNAGDTTCDQRLEKIHQTHNCWILRIPFKDREHQIVDDWISRFHIWPYLDRFAEDASGELLNEFRGRPDLLIGNYSDGNLVATLLSDKLDVIQCTIAHALEKTKYMLSDMFWRDMETEYNFSLQFTADMIAMNKSDFIITSTYQEIGGTESTIGQYESYQSFTLPGLYRVINGVNLFNPKFNVVPPGVDENYYFPYFETKRRNRTKGKYWEERLFSDSSEDICGSLRHVNKLPIFTMARLDKVKNITGLIEAFGMHPVLREKCNLIVAAGTTRLEESKDHEEQMEIKKAHDLIRRFDLQGSLRWLPSIDKLDTGEVYRIIADRRGIFVQPALFEAFGLTILEAMSSGLPTFGPIFGGPSEIIEDNRSGFLINTSHPRLMADAISAFFSACEYDREKWRTISENGIARVKNKFTWECYSRKLISLTQLYGFWRYSAAGEGMIKLDKYCDLIYHLLLKKRAEKLY
jgi:sucrose synthase